MMAQAMTAAFPGTSEEPQVASTANPKFGDYQLNNAMGLFGKMKGQENAPKVCRMSKKVLSVRCKDLCSMLLRCNRNYTYLRSAESPGRGRGNRIPN